MNSLYSSLVGYPESHVDLISVMAFVVGFVIFLVAIHRHTARR